MSMSQFWESGPIVFGDGGVTEPLPGRLYDGGDVNVQPGANLIDVFISACPLLASNGNRGAYYSELRKNNGDIVDTIFIGVAPQGSAPNQNWHNTNFRYYPVANNETYRVRVSFDHTPDTNYDEDAMHFAP